MFTLADELLDGKGSKWRGRDKPAYLTNFPIEFLRRSITKGVDAAMEYAEQVCWEIRAAAGVGGALSQSWQRGCGADRSGLEGWGESNLLSLTR